jgi:formylglycine-generating enzyme required for sulfatase activity
LTSLDLKENRLTNVNLPVGMTNLNALRLSNNRLTSITLPVGMTNLVALRLDSNLLTNILFPSDLAHLETLDLGGNQFTTFMLPSGLTNLTGLSLTGNLLANLTLPPDLTRLTGLGFLGNPLTTLVLSEVLAASTNLTINQGDTLATLPGQGVSVFIYPLEVRLLRPRPLIGAFQFGITGPPGVYTILESTDLAAWSVLSPITNSLGSTSFVDPTAHISPQKFYRALQQSPPTNMVFIAPNTFLMGSPSNDPGRNTFEGPQTRVILTRGYWIGKFEVTQAEYLAVTGENPSNFPGDSRRPISSVNWNEATNYCWILTQRELAAGRIPPGSVYRLPTEAEWECAARAGTSTRFSYGDDPDYSSLTNYAWFLDFASPDLTVHPVGQKLPNAWGLYDTAGNVWEWCQDWYGDQPGGIQTDLTGPASNPNGYKVMRGGAYDYGNSDCRSASRNFRHMILPDSDLGFRVVLACP